MAAHDAVEQLLCVHLGLLDDDDAQPCVRDFRDLYQQPLRAFTDKRALLQAAESTGCAGVILDVLLFVSATMAPALFRKELSRLPLALSQWVHYLVQQCMATNESVSLKALSGILDLYAATQRYRDLATMLLSLVFYHRDLVRSLRVTDEVLEIAKLYRHRLPLWILTLLHEYVELSKLQLVTEKQDAETAPEVCRLAANMDKRARGVGNLQANWRMRYVELQPHEIVYSKHDRDSLSQSRNPFRDKHSNHKGSLPLARGMKVSPLDYRGKFSLRPHCVQICDAAGHEELILDTFTQGEQTQWLRAIAANVKRLEVDPRWLQFPRKSVHRMTMGEFLRYAMLYHGDAHKSHTAQSPCQPGALRDQFQLDPKRYLFSALVTCALARDWKTMEALVQPRSAKSALMALFPSTGGVQALAAASAPASSSVWGAVPTAPPPSSSRYSIWSNNTEPSTTRSSVSTSGSTTPGATGNSAVRGMVDASAIGYGAILDIAEQRHAPPSLLAELEALHEKYDKRGGGGWSCRRDVDDADAASMAITIAIPESVRADTNWD